MRFFYNLSIYCYGAAIHIAAFFNVKAKHWIDGRKNYWQALTSAFQGEKRPVAWFHCASLGEFEQGRPVIELFKKHHPDYSVLLTFFSPSGYLVRKNYSGVDYIFYLPLDTPANAVKFISVVKPLLVCFVKYELWGNLLAEAARKKIPQVLFSACFNSSHFYFKWYGKPYRKVFHTFSHIFVQNQESLELLRGIGYNSVSISGDTRFDRVSDVKNTVSPIGIIDTFCAGSKVLIAGSTWPDDEKIILEWMNTSDPSWKLIIAPHEIDEERIALFIDRSVKEAIRFSDANQADIQHYSVIVINNVGMLSTLYSYGHVAYIGGGFGRGIHNILEAAVFGNPVIFGPNCHRFAEALSLVKLGGAFPVKNIDEFKTRMAQFDDPVILKKAGDTASRYVADNVGATSVIIEKLDSLIR